MGTESSGDPQTAPYADSSRRAACWIWWIGGVETMVFGFAGASLARTAMTPLDQVVTQFQGRISAEQLQLVHGRLWSVTTLLLALGVVPGLVYLGLGFGVRRGALLPIRSALVVAGTQAVVLCVIAVNVFVLALFALDPVAASVGVVLLGTPAVLLVFSLRAILRAKSDQVYLKSIDADPWR